MHISHCIASVARLQGTTEVKPNLDEHEVVLVRAARADPPDFLLSLT
jgi:hypothetical protein